MAHAIIRGENGRRHEVGFDESTMTLTIHLGEENVEIVLESSEVGVLPRKRRFALLNLPRAAFTEALGRSARSSNKRIPAMRKPA